MPPPKKKTEKSTRKTASKAASKTASKAAPKRNRGRQPVYRPEFAAMAERMARHLATTDQQIAIIFGVNVRTIRKWKETYPDFRAALENGKADPDAAVEASLFHRAIGYSHPAQKIFHHEGMITRADYIEHYPPDTAAAFIWLKNRRPREWRDRHEVTVHVGHAERLRAARARIEELERERMEGGLETLKGEEILPALPPGTAPDNHRDEDDDDYQGETD